MRVLVACEESQAVCKQFRELGHDAYSADILDCTGGHPEWHIKGDVLNILNNDWDMMIAFPPCTHLAASGARHFEEKKEDGRQQQGIEFFMKMINAPIPRIAVENPIGIMSFIYRKPDQIIHPYYFGDTYSKATCLWLKNLPVLQHFSEEDSPLIPERVTHVDKGEFVTFSSGKKMAKWYNEASKDVVIRSKTFPGIAKAMAEQWGEVSNLKHNSNPNGYAINGSHSYKDEGGCNVDEKVLRENPSMNSFMNETIEVFGEDYLVIDNRYGLKSIWELKSFLPFMDKNLYKLFKANIRTNNVIDPIRYYVLPGGEKLVIEGHTRLRAAIDTNKKDVPKVEVKEKFESLDDIKAWMINHQLQRRNLSHVERLKLAFFSKEKLTEKARQNLVSGGIGKTVVEPIDTTKEIAKIAGVSPRTVTRYTKVINNASDTVRKQMLNGNISIRDASDRTKNDALIRITEPKQPKQPKQIEPRIISSIEEGQQLLASDEIDALVIIKNADDLNLFNNQEKRKFGFILNNK